MSRPRKKINISEQTDNSVKNNSNCIFSYTKFKWIDAVRLDTIVSREYVEGWATCDSLYVVYHSPAWEVCIMKDEKRNDEYDYKELIDLTESIVKVTGCI